MAAGRMQGAVPAQRRKNSDDDRIRIVKERGIHRGQWFLAAALALVLAALIVVVQPFVTNAPGTQEPRRGDGMQAGSDLAPQRVAGRQPPPRREAAVTSAGAVATIGAPAASNVTPGRTSAPATASAPTGRIDSERGADRGDQAEGIALFPPPGTDPPKPGIIVPEDFELPPGYVRHYQVTDDGKDLPAILMFHPDYKPVDANGNLVPLPEDRVVPPQMAPPGMPIAILEVPPNAVPMIEEEPPGFRAADGEGTAPAGEE